MSSGGGGSQQAESEQEKALAEMGAGQWEVRKNLMPQVDSPYLDLVKKDQTSALQGRTKADTFQNMNFTQMNPNANAAMMGKDTLALGEGLGAGLSAARDSALGRRDSGMQHAITTGAKTGATAVDSMGQLAQQQADLAAKKAEARMAERQATMNMVGDLVGAGVKRYGGPKSGGGGSPMLGSNVERGLSSTGWKPTGSHTYNRPAAPSRPFGRR